MEKQNKFLTEAMGECWHDWTNKYFRCAHCDTHMGEVTGQYKSNLSDAKFANNDFSTWPGFGKLWEWVKQRWWFDSFILSLQPTHRESEIKENLQEGVRIMQIMEFVHPDRFASAVYEFLKEKP